MSFTLDAPGGRTARALLYATEPARAVVDAGTLVAGLPLLMLAPRGEPHPVLVLPGLLADDTSTVTLRRFATWLGYPVAGWSLGRNRGPTRRVVDGLPRLVDRLAGESGQPVSLVGWSLGGVFARRLAMRTPDRVRQVITLGSPFVSPEQLARTPVERPARTPGERAYRRLSFLHVADRIHPDDAGDALPVPSTAVYSRWDGIVDWRTCRQPPGPLRENVGVRASHLGLGHHPGVLWVVADRLAQPKDDWRPFRAPVPFGAGALFTGS
jgi:pimeloyl-ACP methyl ester carboxylesterase